MLERAEKQNAEKQNLGKKREHQDLDFDYSKYDFKMPEIYEFKTKKGLDEQVIKQISYIKGEPEWMLNFRLKAYEIFKKKPLPTWGPDLSEINFDEYYYYIKPTDKKGHSWDEVPDYIKETFERLGIPEAERKFLAGVGAMYESEVVYHKIREDLAKKGVIFVDTDTAVKEYPDLVKEYFGKVIPPTDNKFAALNSAVWSGGSFIYVPPGVKVDLPLQAYFRINAQNVGQFERTLIIADEGSEVVYVEGCFTKGTMINANPDFRPIEEIKPGDKVLTHKGEYKQVWFTQVRPYTGYLYKIKVYGNSCEEINVTEEHPFLCVRRERKNEKNRKWNLEWVKAKDLKKGDYVVTPINKVINSKDSYDVEIVFRGKKVRKTIPLTKEFFRLVGYYLAEGSISKKYYLNFSFGLHERELVEDVKNIIKKVFGIEKFYEVIDNKKHGISLRIASAELCRIFELFGTKCNEKKIPSWLMLESPEKQKELIIGLFRGDGNYYKKVTKSGYLKEVFRINTTSFTLAKQVREILLRLGIASFINSRNREKEGRKTIYTIGITGWFIKPFGDLVGIKVETEINGKKRASMFHLDENYLYSPVRSIKKEFVKNIEVYNFGVLDDESYVANGVAVHNCSAPVYSKDSLHAAVVEIVAKPGARVQYITIQNWSKNVYNLVTKRAVAYEDAEVIWIDGNIGSHVTMKYPAIYLMGKGARGQIISVAYAGKNQIQDTGAKVIHAAPYTKSVITSKSVSKFGGTTTYRGLVKVVQGAHDSTVSVTCDALILDEISKSNTIPTMEILEDDVTISHEASVGRISEDVIFYLSSRGLKESEALAMIVRGFMEPFVKLLPMEYAVEMNRLLELEMEGAVG
jgi:Fe-S cluster assembly protein SufB